MAPRSTRWLARTAGCRVRHNGASRSINSRSTARSKDCMTTAFAISRRRTFAVSIAMSAIAARQCGIPSQFGARRQQARRAPATTPIELLQQYWGATYTTPQTSANQVAYANLTGKVEVTPSWTVETVAHVRAFNQRTVDGNPTGTQPCDADADVAVLRRRQHAGQRAERRAACPIRSLLTRSWAKSIAPVRARPPADFRHRRPTPTRFSGMAIASSSAPASTSASPNSTPAPNSGPSAPTTSSAAAASSSGNPAIPSRSVRCRCARPINIPAFMCSTLSTSPRPSRSPQAAVSTMPALRWRTRSAPSSTAIRHTIVSIRSSAAPTRSIPD